jgi:hypothetical protein
MRLQLTLGQLFRVPLLAVLCLVVALLLLSPAPAAASDLAPSDESACVASPSALPSPVLAANWFTKYLTGVSGRTHVIRICFVTMCLALFILMKKFDGGDGGPRP